MNVARQDATSVVDRKCKNDKHTWKSNKIKKRNVLMAWIEHKWLFGRIEVKWIGKKCVPANGSRMDKNERKNKTEMKKRMDEGNKPII